jgi:hypothetical protein
MHVGFIGSHKLSIIDGHGVGCYLTISVVMYTGIVYEPPMDSLKRYHVEDMHLGEVGPRLTF